MKNNRWLIIVAVLMGVFTASLVYVYIGNLSQIEEEPVKTVSVVMADQELTPRTVIRPELLVLKEVPLDLVDPSAIVDVREAQGRVVRDTIAAGEQLSRDRLFPAGEVPGLPFAIPSGKRAVTVAVNEVIGVAGFVKPGDYVDILGTFDKEEGAVTIPVLQGVLVLAIAQDMSRDLDDQPRVTTTVTVAVSLNEAQKLTLAEEKGYLRLVLRPVDTLSREVVRAVDTEELTGTPRPTATSVSTSKRTTTVTKAVSRPAPEPQDSVVEVIRGTEKTDVKVGK